MADYYCRWDDDPWDDIPSPLVSERPNFGPRQVRDVVQLTPGLSVADNRGNNYTVVEVKGVWITVLNVHGRQENISLADKSIVPYDNGHWNGINYLVFND